MCYETEETKRKDGSGLALTGLFVKMSRSHLASMHMCIVMEAKIIYLHEGEGCKNIS